MSDQSRQSEHVMAPYRVVTTLTECGSVILVHHVYDIDSLMPTIERLYDASVGIVDEPFQLRVYANGRCFWKAAQGVLRDFWDSVEYF